MYYFIKKTILILIVVVYSSIYHTNNAYSQNTLKGNVSGKSTENQNNISPIAFATVYWQSTNESTTTDESGNFIITFPHHGEAKLIISMVGYKSDTIEVKHNKNELSIILDPDATLDLVSITGKQDGNYISKIKQLKTEIITENGLEKLACCNLSESFENTATIDVAYTDAVSGAKKIQMLGLSGIYSQILTEMTPSIRGLASNYGLSYIPGSWMQSIQVSKGTSSVVNGYESTTGQINIELKKPEHNPDKLYVNIYGNNDSRAEANINTSLKISNRVSTMFLTHGSINNMKIDHNNDGFLDIPTGYQINIVNRWTFERKEEKGHTQLIINYLRDLRNGGQTEYYNATEEFKSLFYKTESTTNRFQAIIKSGLRFEAPYKSLGILASATYHEQNSVFGNNKYSGIQKSGYGNLIWQTIIANTNHKISTGVSIMYDEYNEHLNDSVFSRTEAVPGIFGQYTWLINKKIDVIAGLRIDYNSSYGIFITPRVHSKWSINDMTTLRVSAGKGYRSPNIIAENTSLLANNRLLIFKENFKAEEAWNYGINIVKEFLIDEDRKASISADFYRTDFTNRIIIDMDNDAQKILFYNLKGQSYSNSFQVDGMIQPLKRVEISAAFRINDSKSTYSDSLMETPFVSKYKGLLTLSYATKHEKWKIDLTSQYNGISRLPSTASSPVSYRRDNYSKEFYIVHAQVTKKFKHIEIYTGVENLMNFKQENPIVSADDPQNKYFDASMIWGPLSGRMFYGGLRLKIK